MKKKLETIICSYKSVKVWRQNKARVNRCENIERLRDNLEFRYTHICRMSACVNIGSGGRNTKRDKAYCK
jgi:hypothetical protein